MPRASSTPGIEALANTWFAVLYHLDDLGSEKARAEKFLRQWDEVDRPPVIAIPDHAMWKLPT